MIPIRRVTIHRDGAIVEREGSATVHEGRVVVAGLPLSLDRGSLRAHVQGGTVRQVRIELEVPEERPVPVEQGDSRAEIEAELRRVEAEIAALQVERQAAVQLAPGWDPEGGLPSPARVTRWAELEAAVGPWVERVDFALRDARARREELTARAKELPLEAPITQPGWEDWQPTQQAVLQVEGEGEVQVALSYRVPGARWSPAYQLHADGLLTEGRLVLRAWIAQATGEDWSQVELRLSSRSSTRAVALPPLLPFRMGAPRPAPPAAWRGLAADFDSLFGAELPTAEHAPGAHVATWSADEDLHQADTLTTDESWEVEGLVEDDLVEIAAAGQEEELDDSLRFELPEIREAPGAPPEAPLEGDDGQDTAITGLSDVQADPGASKSPSQTAIRVENALLEYEHVRLGGPLEHDSVRGRLVLSGDRWPADMPAGARPQVARWARRWNVAHQELGRRALPPHHHDPAPPGGVEVEYVAEGLVDLPTNGESRWLAVFSQPLELHVRYTSVPRNELRAYRRIQAELERPAPLLPGPFQVFVEGEPETTVAWEGTGPHEPLDLSLGAEDRITVARNVKYREERVESSNGARRFHTTVDVRVTSELPREVSVHLIERVPVPDEGGGPAVEITTSTPIAKPYQGAVTADMEGARVQTLDVPPNGEARAVLGYVIGLRSGEEIAGGNPHG